MNGIVLSFKKLHLGGGQMVLCLCGFLGEGEGEEEEEEEHVHLRELGLIYALRRAKKEFSKWKVCVFCLFSFGGGGLFASSSMKKLK